MRRVRAVLGILLLSLPGQLKATEFLSAAPAQEVRLPSQGIESLSIVDPGVAHAEADPNGREIILHTLKPGMTDLLLQRKDGTAERRTLRVSPAVLHAQAKEIAEILAGLDKVRVRVLGERIWIEGEVFRLEDLQRIAQVAALYPQLTHFVQLSQKMVPTLLEEINRRLRQEGLSQVRATNLGSQVLLSGEVGSEVERQQALTLARLFAPEPRDLLAISHSREPLVRVDVTFLELNRTHLRNLGMRWQQALETVGKVQLGLPGANLTLTSQAQATLDLIEKKGWGHILSQPSLICRSGEEAQFLSGGEIPIRLVSERSANVIFKPYGIMLRIVPRRIQESLLALQVNTEISSLDGANSVENIPAFLSRKLSSAVTLESGQSLVLGGLTDQNEAKAVERVPGLADIPGLGELFKSRRQRSASTELLIFMTPNLLAAPDATSIAQIQAITTKKKEILPWLRPRLND